MTRIGLLGGTFDPPHLGHLVVAEGVRDALDLAEVRLLVAGDPWMKHGESPAHHRVAMTRLACEPYDRITVDDRETRRPGATYTAETLEDLHAESPDVSWYFLLGADAASTLSEWHRGDEVRNLATLVVVDRPGHPRPAAADALVHVQVPLIGISSTDIRGRVAAGRSIRVLVPDPVVAYVNANGLYRPHDV